MYNTVRVGGLLFEYYLDMFIPTTMYKQWRKARAIAIASEDYIPEELEDTICTSVEGRFYGFVVQGVLDLYKGARFQRFYVTFLGQFHGLSRLGSDLLSTWGFSMPSSSYDRALTLHMEQAQEECRCPHAIFEHTDSHTMWLDYF
jgi:hypothetical protein